MTATWPSWRGIAVAPLLAAVAVIVIRPVVPRAFGPVATVTADLVAWTLPLDMSICNRDWKRSTTPDIRPIEFIREAGGVEPAVVDPRPFAPCPPGPCGDVADGPCHTVIYVRVAEDGYVAYELRGGP
jgi:hypothetical protein